jgi:NitT/TauT family transport system permease protein
MRGNWSFTLPVLFGLTLVLLWELTVFALKTPLYIMPAPSDIILSLWENHVNLAQSLFITIKVTVSALILASFSGAGLAILLVQSKLIEKTFFPYAVFLQVTPIVTIAPFIIIWVDDIFRLVNFSLDGLRLPDYI